MAGFLGQLLTASCGCLSPLLLFGLTLLIQKAPAIINALQRMLRWFLRLTFLLYRFFLVTLTSIIGLSSPRGILRTVCTSIISVLICIIVMHLLMDTASWICVGVALAHGIYLGLAWEQLADPEGLHIGIPIQ
jgi:hypothetical protein